MKRYLIYLVILIAGILVGKFALSGEATHQHSHAEETIEKQTQWTCSMHPQIMLPESGDCPICGMDLIPAQESTAELSSNQFRMTKNAIALANIETTKVATGNAEGTALKLTGTIEANEKTNAIQTAHFGGRIEKLFVNFTGEQVRRGQKIALIYSPELVTTQQELLTAMRMKASQPALYKAVRNKLKLWKLTEAQIQQLETSQKVSTQFPIYASVSGVVTEKLVEEGNHVMEGGAMFKVSNLNTVWASFDAYEDQIGILKKGDAINITTNADPTKEISANITFIDPVLNTNTRTVAVKVALQNSDHSLKPGMFVTGLLTKKAVDTKALRIPKSSILWTGKRSLVYVKKEANEPVFEAREVVLGKTTGAYCEIVSGLDPKEEIVTNGAFTVDAAAQLQGKKSMMNVQDASKEKNNDPPVQLDAAFEKDFQPSINAYIALKNALVQSDSLLAAKNSEVFRVALEKLTSSQKKISDPHWAIMHKISKSIHKDATIARQRKSFETISNSMIALVKNFQQLQEPLTIQFCPMANNDKGAYWLSSESEIKNPYFGNAMLTCGSVTQVLGIDN